MSDVHTYSSDVAFTPAVKAIQTRKGSREGYAQAEARGGWRTEIDENLAAFLGQTNSFYLATATADGQPYIQHRGGPKGFVKILDKNTIAFADYSGNRQYITQGNLSENPKAYIFVMDYAHRRRVKTLGRGARGRGRSGAAAIADAAGLPRAAGAGDPVQDRGVGHQLPAAHSAQIRCGRCGGSARRARRTDRRARGGAGGPEGAASPCRLDIRPPRACCSGFQANSG